MKGVKELNRRTLGQVFSTLAISSMRRRENHGVRCGNPRCMPTGLEGRSSCMSPDRVRPRGSAPR